MPTAMIIFLILSEENTEYCGLGWKRDPKTKHCYQLNTKQTTWDGELLCILLSVCLFYFLKKIVKTAHTYSKNII